MINAYATCISSKQPISIATLIMDHNRTYFIIYISLYKSCSSGCSWNFPFLQVLTSQCIHIYPACMEWTTDHPYSRTSVYYIGTRYVCICLAQLHRLLGYLASHVFQHGPGDAIQGHYTTDHRPPTTWRCQLLQPTIEEHTTNSSFSLVVSCIPSATHIFVFGKRAGKDLLLWYQQDITSNQQNSPMCNRAPFRECERTTKVSLGLADDYGKLPGIFRSNSY